jgi:hypothetical protein
MTERHGVVTVGTVGSRIRRRSVTVVAVGAVAAALIVPATASATSAPSAAHGLVGHPGVLRVGPRVRTQGWVNSSRSSGASVRAGRATGPTYAQDSSNWSGIGRGGRGVTGAYASWTVPAIKASSRKLYSASWVGVDGFSNDHLIQTGTGQDTVALGRTPKYFAWVEILPAASQTLFLKSGKAAPVKPGNKMSAYVKEVRKGVWTIAIENRTEHWAFAKNFKYTGPGTSLETIEEAPTINGKQSVPADFGTVHFSGLGISVKGKSGKYSTAFTASNEIYLKQRGRVLAKASAPTKPSTRGQSFSVKYEG